MSTTATSAAAPAPPRRAGLAALAGPMMVAIAVQSLANLVFHAALGRSLSADAYAAVGSVLAAMTLAAVPLTALQTAAARTSAVHGLCGRTGRASLLRTAGWLMPVTLAVLAAGGPVAGFLLLASRWDAALLAPALLVAGLLATARGLLLGVSRTGRVAASYGISTGVRLLAGLPCAVLWGVTGALAATVAAEFAALVHATRPLLPALPGPSAIPRPREVATTAVVVTGLFAFTTVDLFLARHFLPGDASGAYVAAATIGKTVLALPAAAMSVAYPRLVSAWSEPGTRAAALRSSMLVVVGPAAAVSLVVAIVPQLPLTVMFGAQFAGSADLVRALGLIAGASALVSVLTHAALARGSRAALVPWVGALLQIVGISFRHQSPAQIAGASALSMALVALLLCATEGRRWRS